MNTPITVLYVEDDPDIRSIAEMALEDEGFELLMCESGQQALERATQCRADLLLLDVMMPLLDGPTTLTRLRELPHFTQTPVIFMTAKVQPAEVEQYKAMGAIGVIHKPFDPIELASRIHQLLRDNQPTEKPKDLGSKLRLLKTQFSATLPDRIATIFNEWQALQGDFDETMANDLIRNAHSLGGSAATFGFHQAGKQALHLEALLQHNTPNFYTPEITQEITTAIETLADIIRQGPEQTAIETLPTTSTSKNNNSSDQSYLLYMLEDDVALATEAQAQLRHFDYHIKQFNDLAAIKAAIAVQTPDALLLDISLQEGRTAGCDFAAEIRASELPDVPIIFLSAHDTWEDRLNAVHSGGQAFLTKPINFDELAEMLDHMSGRTLEQPYRVLIVDDTELLAEHYAMVLQEAGMETLALNDPATILAVLPEFMPDLILMDIYMPSCSGIDVANVIRQHGSYLHLPIAYLSTEKSLQKQLDALRVGGDDFLQKPISDQHLLTAVTFRVSRFRQLNELMNTDSLTGLLNHINLKLTLERELSGANRRKGQLAFAMIDIDKFKDINDKYGHPVGDRVIKSLARLLKMRLRNSDISARYGGEEFAIVLPDTSLNNAKQLLDDLRDSFSNIVFTHDACNFSVTFSSGIASSLDHPDIQSLISAADYALYQAKHRGRNQVVKDERVPENTEY